jgi:tRNA nucleotidyltransferase (CCA-adding enzyme)
MAMTPDSKRFPLPPDIKVLGQAIHAAGGVPVLVGGWVRDCLLGHPHSKDFDLEVFALAPDALRAVLARFGAVHAVGRHFGVLKLAARGLEFDVSVPRRESKTGKGHKGFMVEPDPGMTFEQAAARRDFTINSMGYEFLEERFLNPHGGLEDLEARLLRHVGPAFAEDPLRVLRAMQFAGRFELTIAPETLAICRAQDLAELPRERVWEEVKKLMQRSARPSLGWRYAEELNVLRILPELAALKRLEDRPDAGPGAEAWRRALATVDAVTAQPGGGARERLTLALAALCHELGRTAPGLAAAPYGAPVAQAAAAPVTALLTRMTNEQDVTRAVAALIRELPAVPDLHARRGQPGVEADVRRLALHVPLAPLAQLAAARHRALHAGAGPAEPPEVAWLRDEATRLGVWEGPPEPLLMGRHLLERGFPRGPAMGHLLRRAFERQLDGDIRTLDDALAWLDGQPRGGPPQEARP